MFAYTYVYSLYVYPKEMKLFIYKCKIQKIFNGNFFRKLGICMFCLIGGEPEASVSFLWPLKSILYFYKSCIYRYINLCGLLDFCLN